MSLPNQKKGVSGFTLVEMAIVLVIIGIILAGVMKGRDIVRGAQVKQFSQQFAQKWGTVAQTYYDKTGQQLNDGTVNGGVVDPPDGVMDASAPANSGDGTAGGGGIVDVLNSTGIAVCTIVKSKLEDVVAGSVAGDPDQGHCGTPAAGNFANVFQALVEGEYCGPQTVTVDLAGTQVNVGGQLYQRNMIVFYNLPTDVAIGIDTAIDGRAIGNLGNCINLGTAAGGAVANQGYAPAVGGGTLVATGATWIAKIWGNAQDLAADGCTTLGIILDY